MSVTLNVNGHNLRIKRADSLNLVIETLTEPKKPGGEPQWVVFRHYGKIEDLAHGLVNLVADIPQADDLIEQLALLRLEIRNLEQTISSQLKMSSGRYKGDFDHSSALPEAPISEAAQ